MKLKFDNLRLGLILGFIAPAIAFFILFYTKFEHLTFKEFIGQLVNLKIFSKVVSLTVLPNLLLFFIFIWTNKLRSARGVLTATVILAVFVLIAKFLI